MAAPPTAPPSGRSTGRVAQRDPAGPADLAIGPAARTVLLVEDDPALREQVAEWLGDAGYGVVCAADGERALGALEWLRPALAIVDLDLPGVTGFRLLRVLRRDPALAEVPVIVATGYDQQEAGEIFDAAAPEAYVRKPYSSERLLADVRRLIDAPCTGRAA